MLKKLYDDLPLTFPGNSNQKTQLFILKILAKTFISQGLKSSFNLLCQVFYQILKVRVVQTHMK
jgi:hypothetical protein